MWLRRSTGGEIAGSFPVTAVLNSMWNRRNHRGDNSTAKKVMTNGRCKPALE
ncbi:MAG: hypothetical protein ACLTBV_17525 [Enterocloster bolteae]